MALIDTAFDTVKDALDAGTDLASDRLDTVSATLGEIAADERSRKKLVFFLLLAVLALIGYVAWKKSSSSGDSEGETA
jgi:hypothetical protein